MNYEGLEFDFGDGVGWIRINRPASFNAMDLKTMQELLHVANRCSTDKAVRLCRHNGGRRQGILRRR
jgi:enoyl-CoA hydratase/carnithine racemase